MKTWRAIDDHGQSFADLTSIFHDCHADSGFGRSGHRNSLKCTVTHSPYQFMALKARRSGALRRSGNSITKTPFLLACWPEVRGQQPRTARIWFACWMRESASAALISLPACALTSLTKADNSLQAGSLL